MMETPIVRFDKIVAGLDSNADKSKLLIHSCCAPCSSYCLVYLRRWFDITCLFYNPNITDCEEYEKRLEELKRLVDELNDDAAMMESDCVVRGSHSTQPGHIDVIAGDFEPELFREAAQGLEDAPEGGARCARCFDLRLSKTCEVAVTGDWDYVSTTLTISPLKNAAVLNSVGDAAANRYNVKWLPSDFKKRNGYKHSIELSAYYGLYRQNYCGCDYSLRPRQN